MSNYSVGRLCWCVRVLEETDVTVLRAPTTRYLWACLSCCLSQHIPIRTLQFHPHWGLILPCKLPALGCAREWRGGQPFLLYFNSVCGDWDWAFLPGPHISHRPQARASTTLRGPDIRIGETENVSSIGLSISTVTSSATKHQWEETCPLGGSSYHHSHI